MITQTQHVGYNTHDVIVSGQVVGRAWSTNDKWHFQGNRHGVVINIVGRDSLTEVVCLAARLFIKGGLL